jgi:hypothetical protein
MSVSPFDVWAIVRQLPDMQNAVVSRFRRRSDAEECLRLYRRHMPHRNHLLIYAPADQDLGVLMDAIPQDWAMYNQEGNAEVAKMMQDLKKALKHQPLPQVRELLKRKFEAVSNTYPEIYDTDVRQTITARLTTWACQVHELPTSSALSSDYWDL